MPEDRQLTALREHGRAEEADALELARSAEGKAEAFRRVQVALVLIERAQHDLERACQELSGILWAVPPWKRVGTLAERAHGLWRWVSYEWLPKSSHRLELDGTAALSFLRRRRAPKLQSVPPAETSADQTGGSAP